jgi:hypothetical protein
MEDVAYVEEDEEMDDDDDLGDEAGDFDDGTGSEHTSVTNSADEGDEAADGVLDIEAGGSTDGWQDEDEDMDEDEHDDDREDDDDDDEGDGGEDEEMVWAVSDSKSSICGVSCIAAGHC